MSLTDTGQPGISRHDPEPPATPTHRAPRRVRASTAERELAALLDSVRDEIRDYAREHPGAEIEILWRTVGGEDNAE